MGGGRRPRNGDEGQVSRERTDEIREKEGNVQSSAREWGSNPVHLLQAPMLRWTTQHTPGMFLSDTVY